MKKTILIVVSIFIAGTALVSFSADYTAPQPSVKPYEGVPYISGGIGVDERNMLDAIARDYNLKIVFAITEGNYLADIAVQIKDAEGTIVLEAVSDGPWFFTNLALGEYTVKATMSGKAISQTVRINPKTRTELYCYWPG